MENRSWRPRILADPEGCRTNLAVQGSQTDNRATFNIVRRLGLSILSWLWAGQRQRIEPFLLVCIQQRLDLGFRVAACWISICFSKSATCCSMIGLILAFSSSVNVSFSVRRLSTIPVMTAGVGGPSGSRPMPMSGILPEPVHRWEAASH